MGARRQARELALQALYSWAVSNTEVEELITFPWVQEEKNKLLPDTQYFAAFMVKGTIENIEEIDAAIKQHIEHWDFSRLSKVDLAILRISIFSLIYQKDVPTTVTINEAIDIAKDFSNDDSYRFINGVLDGFRKKRNI